MRPRKLLTAGWALVVLASALGAYLVAQQHFGSHSVSPAPKRVVYFACCGIIPLDPQTGLQSSYRPESLTLDATGSHYIKGVTWLEWNSTEAIARGTAFVNSCNPACVGGRVDKDPVTAKFTAPILCRSHWFWSKVLLHFPRAIPSGEQQDDDFLLVPATSDHCGST